MKLQTLTLLEPKPWALLSLSACQDIKPKTRSNLYTCAVLEHLEQRRWQESESCLTGGLCFPLFCLKPWLSSAKLGAVVACRCRCRCRLDRSAMAKHQALLVS